MEIRRLRHLRHHLIASRGIVPRWTAVATMIIGTMLQALFNDVSLLYLQVRLHEVEFHFIEQDLHLGYRLKGIQEVFIIGVGYY